MTLYEINQQIECWEPEVDETTGEVLNFDALRELNMARDEKIENIACWIKNMVAEAKAIREEEKALAERRQAMERKSERLKTFLSLYLDGQKFQTPRCALTFRRSEQVVIADEGSVIALAKHAGLPVLREKVEIDKTALKAQLAAGVEIPGVSIEEKNNLIIK